MQACAGGAAFLGYQQLQCKPQCVAGKYHGRYKVERELNVVYIQMAVVEAAGYHHPADEALQCTQQKEDDERAYHLPVEIAAHEEVHKPYQEDDAQHARPEAVQPLPEEDTFKVCECVAAVHVFELAYLFVAIKGVVPLFGVERGQYPEDGVPLGDGEAGAGEAGNAAQQRL